MANPSTQKRENYFLKDKNRNETVHLRQLNENFSCSRIQEMKVIPARSCPKLGRQA